MINIEPNSYYFVLMQFKWIFSFSGNGKCDDRDDDSEPVSLDKGSGDLSCGQSSENEKSGNDSVKFTKNCYY